MGKMAARRGEQRAMRKLQHESCLEDQASAFCRLPSLFVQGASDIVTSVDAASQFHDRLGNPDKEFKTFDGLYHAIYEEPERDHVIDYVVEWLNKRFPLEEEHPRAA